MESVVCLGNESPVGAKQNHPAQTKSSDETQPCHSVFHGSLPLREIRKILNEINSGDYDERSLLSSGGFDAKSPYSKIRYI